MGVFYSNILVELFPFLFEKQFLGLFSWRGKKIPLFNFLDLLVCRRVSSPTFYEKITFGRKEGGKNFPVDFFIFLFQLHLLQSKRQKMRGG